LTNRNQAKEKQNHCFGTGAGQNSGYEKTIKREFLKAKSFFILLEKQLA